MSVPRAFLSYSHDSLEHKRWVLQLGTRLQSSGIDTVLDQWSLGPGDDIPSFMEKNLAAADRVLMVCTSRYVQKVNAGVGGVGYEKMIVTAELMKSVESNKVIPLVRQSAAVELPTFLRSKLFVDFSRDEDFEFSFDQLSRAIHGAPLFKRPPVGTNPFSTEAAPIPEPASDLVDELMRVVARAYEGGTSYFYSESLRSHTKMSRITVEVALGKAFRQGLCRKDKAGNFWLTDEGRLYIHERNLAG
jgi:hypothetical protein